MSRRSKGSRVIRPDRWSNILTHQTMIGDRSRTLAYKKAIERNVQKNDIVLDMGCGTGLLAGFAAKKGCKRA